LVRIRRCQLLTGHIDEMQAIGEIGVMLLLFGDAEPQAAAQLAQ
jgi:hypothetical protein